MPNINILSVRMAHTGLLVLTQPSRVGRILPVIQEHVKNTLYVHLQPYNIPHQTSASVKDLSCIYSQARQHIQDVDVRVLLSGVKYPKLSNINTRKEVGIVFFDNNCSGAEMNSFVRSYLTNVNPNYQVLNLSTILDVTGNESSNLMSTGPSTESEAVPVSGSSKKEDHAMQIRMYENVVLGGTFDRLHSGHKILLSEAVIHCSKRLVVGVTDTAMLKSKKLWELIEPCGQRMNIVEDFLRDVDPSLQYDVVPITDPYGPTKDDPSFQMIVVSAETLKGGKMVNQVRAQNGLCELDIHVVDLLQSDDSQSAAGIEEPKISSSNHRLRLLGTELRPREVKANLPHWPYVIGFTGGIASGKTAMCKRIERFGPGIIDCDILAHKLYRKGEICYQLVVDHFGESILDAEGEVDRKKLGPIVFNDKEKLKLLNDILWPRIMNRAQEECQELYKKGYRIVVIEAALLIQAGWDQICHEVWLCIVSPDVALERLQVRNKLSPNEAKKRLDAQMSNAELVAHANVVFCTEWDPEFSQSQVEKAWNGLQKFLQTRPEP